MKQATSSNWKTEPLPEERTTIPLDLSYSQHELRDIQLGVVPVEMEDKWFIYWEDDTLFFHRSWTGFCLYVVRFAREDDGVTAVEAELNRDSEQYRNTDDDYDREMISFLINLLLLKRQAPFPSKEATRSNRALEMFHLVGDAALGRHPGDDREPLFQIKSRCYLCKHKFSGHPGCMAFPIGLPFELAIGDRMHDESFPGDRGYLFEKRIGGDHMICDHLYRGEQVMIPMDQILVDAYVCDYQQDESANTSYQHFLKFFEDTDKITQHELIIGASFTYSWMPRVLGFKKLENIEKIAAYLDAVRLDNGLDHTVLSMIKEVVNRSMIGTSKLLHFVNPGRYPIIDKWVDTYLNGTPSYDRQNDVDHYMSYTCACRRAVEDERFKAVHQNVNKSLAYEVSALRALELIMFLTAKSQSRK